MGTTDVLTRTEEDKIPEGIRARVIMLRGAYLSISCRDFPGNGRVLILITSKVDDSLARVLGLNDAACLDTWDDGEVRIRAVQLSKVEPKMRAFLPLVAKRIEEESFSQPVLIAGHGGVALTRVHDLSTEDIFHLVNIGGHVEWVEDPSMIVSRIDGLADVIRLTVGGLVGQQAADQIDSAVGMIARAIAWSHHESEAAYRAESDDAD
jgi:hypothetical protein